MDRSVLLELIKQDFDKLHDVWEVLGILIFGSYAWDMETDRSDIDICIIAPRVNIKELKDWIFENIPCRNYDIKIFEEIPLFIKMEVIEKHILIYSRDKLDLYEYFYFFRKIWKDQKYRNTMTYEELKARLK